MANLTQHLKDIDTSKADTTYVDNKPTGFKNYIINGGFDVWQRGVSQSTAGMNSVDRWHFVYGDTVTQQADGTMRVVGINSSSRFNQKIEGDHLCGKTVMLSFANDDTNSSRTVRYLVNGGSWTAVTANYTHTNSQGFRVFEISFTFPAKITGGYVQIEVYNTNKTIDWSYIQLEEGSVATPSEQRPYGLELSLCQRYYQYYPDMLEFKSGTTKVYGSVIYQTQMRTTPSETHSGNAIKNISKNSLTVYDNSNTAWVTNLKLDAEL